MESLKNGKREKQIKVIRNRKEIIKNLKHTIYRRKKIKGKQNQYIVSRKGKKHEISEEHAEGLKE